MAHKTIATAVPPSVYMQLSAQAKREQKSMSELLREFINCGLTCAKWSSELETDIAAIRNEVHNARSTAATANSVKRLEKQINELRLEMRQLSTKQPAWAIDIERQVDKIQEDLFFNRIVQDELRQDSCVDYLIDAIPADEQTPVLSQLSEPAENTDPVVLRISQSESVAIANDASTGSWSYFKRLAGRFFTKKSEQESALVCQNSV